MRKNVVLTGVGRDRVGIVAKLSSVLYDIGCNLLDSSMTLLRGEFAVILMAQLPEGSSIEELQEKLKAAEEELEMNVYVRELKDDELEEEPEDETAYIISVYGADRPGIVYGVTQELARLKVNLTDVETKKTSASKPIFYMVLEVTLPNGMKESQLKKELKRKAEELDVDISVQAVEYMEI